MVRVNLPGDILPASQVYYEFHSGIDSMPEWTLRGSLWQIDVAPKLRPYLCRPATWTLSYLQGLLDGGGAWPRKPQRGLAVTEYQPSF